MSKNAYPLKLSTSVKKAAGDDFLRQRAGTAKPKDMLEYLRRAPKVAPNTDDMP
jgi:hypothetical protein